MDKVAVVSAMCDIAGARVDVAGVSGSIFVRIYNSPLAIIHLVLFYIVGKTLPSE
jgi:hypothetical protein